MVNREHRDCISCKVNGIDDPVFPLTNPEQGFGIGEFLAVGRQRFLAKLLNSTLDQPVKLKRDHPQIFDSRGLEEKLKPAQAGSTERKPLR